MSIPKEPRQMMINMMYLVLTALLAMNVSAEILNAFHTVNQGITNSNVSADGKISGIMSAFQGAMTANKTEAESWYEKAQTVDKETKVFTDYVDSLKSQVITASDGWVDAKTNVHHKSGAGWTESAGFLSNHSNLDATTYIFLENEKEKPQAPILKDKIEKTREQLLSVLDKDSRARIEPTLPLAIIQPAKNDEGVIKTWEEANFHMVPTIATVTLLNKFINDAKNAEAQILADLYGHIGANQYRANVLTAKLIAPSSYVLEGQHYTADVFVAAYNNTQDPEVYLGALNASAVKDKDGNYTPVDNNPVAGGTKADVKDGMGKIDNMASGDAEHTVSGAVMVKIAGVPKYFPFEQKWQSAKAAVVISPEKMNVFYIGVPNPVAISIPGIPSDRIIPAIGQGTISPATEKGHYIVNVTTQGNTDVSVSAKIGDKGVVQKMGGMTFRVKRIPDPMGMVGTLKPGSINSSQFRAQGFVLANLENFDFDARFNVISFSMTYFAKRQDPQPDVQPSGTKFTDKMQKWVQNAKPGDIFYIDEIKVKGPDGSIRKLSSISYKIN